MLKLLLNHHLLEVEDTFQGGACGEVSEIGRQLLLINQFWLIVSHHGDSKIPQIWKDLMKKRLEFVVFILAREELV